MKVLILTSSLYGTASGHLSLLTGESGIEVTMVIFNEGRVSNKKKQYLDKVKKILKIGILGAWNGIRMRKWFKTDIQKYIAIENIEEICLRSGIPFFRTPSINCDTTRTLFSQAGADVGLSLGNGYIGKKLFTIPKYGMLNIHHEILPEYQNAQSIIWQLYNGSSVTGYTIHKIDSKIDTGEIIYQENVPIKFRETLADTVAFTSALLLKSSAIGLVKVLNDFKNYYGAAKPQGKGQTYTTPTYRQYLKIQEQFKKLKRQP